MIAPHKDTISALTGGLSGARLPHPIPYQGSKRLLAPAILKQVKGRKFKTVYEPFSGSGAFSIAAAANGVGGRFVLSDSLESLIGIWSAILNDPETLATRYEDIWSGQEADPGHYNRVREEFNAKPDAARLLYLLARCVKNSPRFNREGKFNQSPDLRRRGMHPDKMRREIVGVHGLLAGIAVAIAGDFEKVISKASSDDLVYMDPPYQGVSGSRDKRYYQGLERERLIAVLADLAEREVPVLLSYDGRCGEKSYGEPLPDSLGLVRLEVCAGRSTQATLNGRDDETFESLYVSRSLIRSDEGKPEVRRVGKSKEDSPGQQFFF